MPRTRLPYLADLRERIFVLTQAGRCAEDLAGVVHAPPAAFSVGVIGRRSTSTRAPMNDKNLQDLNCPHNRGNSNSGVVRWTQGTGQDRQMGQILQSTAATFFPWRFSWRKDALCNLPERISNGATRPADAKCGLNYRQICPRILE